MEYELRDQQRGGLDQPGNCRAGSHSENLSVSFAISDLPQHSQHINSQGLVVGGYADAPFFVRLSWPRKKADSGHGHVHPRADGQRARCGGPGICDQCSREQALANAQVVRA